MKLLLVSGSPETPKLISAYGKPLGFELIWYNHIIKAMDNIDEIDPSLIVISARDFPRQWKTMAQFLKGCPSAENCKVILLTGNELNAEEESKAKYLGICGIVPEEPQGTEIELLKDTLKCCMQSTAEGEKPGAKAQSVSFVFSIPGDFALITGEVKGISAGGISFLPDNAEIKKSLKMNTEISGCSLRAGEEILSPVCRLEQTEPFLEMKFLSFRPGEQEMLLQYLKANS